MQSLINIINARLTKYLHYPGDSREILLHKKIWWLINFAGVFTLLLAIILVYDPQYGSNKDVVDIVFLFAMPIALIAFHFYKRRIENWAFISQIFLILITSYKVYLMGGAFIGRRSNIYRFDRPRLRLNHAK